MVMQLKQREIKQRESDESLSATLNVPRFDLNNIEFIDSREFQRVSEGELTEKEILNTELDFETTPPEYNNTILGRTPWYEPLTREAEQFLFRKMNYLKWKSEKIASGSDFNETKKDDVNLYLAQSEEIRNLIAEHNLRLVVSLSGKFYKGDPVIPIDMISSEIYTTLFKAIDKFDYTKGFKFSTYMTYAVMGNISRFFKVELKKARSLTSAEFNEGRSSGVEVGSDYLDLAKAQINIDTVALLLSKLNEKERDLLKTRFGIDQDENSTLREVGVRLGVTKERVRQIQVKALNKLKHKISEGLIDLPFMSEI